MATGPLPGGFGRPPRDGIAPAPPWAIRSFVTQRIEALEVPHDVHDDIQKILLSEDQILTGIDRVAREVTQSYRGRKFTVVSILKGSCVFASDLIRRIPIPLELAFVSASSYGDRTSAGDLDLNFFPTDQEIQGRNLLLVDDILDTGKTMSALVEAFHRRGAGEVRTCVFLDKPQRRAVEFQADFRAFEVENLFVVGYGLDFAGEYRNLPYVGALRPDIYERAEAAVGEAAG